MPQELTEMEKWEIIGKIKVSPNKYKTLKTIENEYMMPSEIARYSGLRITQVSNALKNLKKDNLVECINEEAKKGRLYHNTELGLEILEMIEDNKND
ncbi:MarR family transcriptional regulator [Methanobrevibacter sp.]|uniref:MarR family transcriptional regulator n=1 Tax=Methanobrevibacter sp. TaxID=66852 RepID=UPI00388CFCEF